MVALACSFAGFFVVPSGCVTSSKKLIEVRLGMSKAEVQRVLGDPAVVRGAIRNKYDQVIEVWQYRLALPSSDSAGQVIGKSMWTLLTLGIAAEKFHGERRDYWLYFLRDKLVQWGQAGDWSREPDRIYQFNFEPRPVAPH
jgi:hypothetical protein